MAPLKQEKPRPAQANRGTSPRSRERGPVEARPSRAFTCLFFRTLHAHASVAPLKLTNKFQSGPVNYTSPRSRERGPVEAEERRHAGARGLALHAHASVAPLKLNNASGEKAIVYLSTLTRAWPR